MAEDANASSWGIWLHGLLAAFIGGGSGAVSAGFSVSMVDPDHFNTGNGLHQLVHTMWLTFIVSGLLTTFAYLKQSPVPRQLWTEQQRAATQKVADKAQDAANVAQDVADSAAKDVGKSNSASAGK